MKTNESISTTQRRTSHIIHSFNHTALKCFFQEVSLVTSLGIAFFIATGYIFYLFPSRFLGGHGGLFDRLEPLTSLSGWWAFKSEPWRFPLFSVRLLNAPEGANIAFTNSIPLMGMLFKPFQHFLPKDYHYFGIWFAISYLAQAIGATFAIRSLGHRTILASIAATMMSLMMPTLLWQTDNIPLVSQAYLLFGFSLYFTGLKKPQLFKEIANTFTLLLSLALLTHPYLLLMTSIFYLAFVGEYWSQSSRNRQNCLIALMTTSFFIIAIFITGGYFGQTLRNSGYGHYSMNLLAPFSGGKLGQQLAHATKGQMRGFNYLGMGTFLSLVLAIIAQRKRIIDILFRHRILAGILVLLTIFAISNQVSYGKQILLRYPVFFPFSIITDIFRSSGRLFWPCGYTLMMIGLAGILRLEDKPLILLSVFLVVSIQFYDTTPLRHSLHRAVRTPASTANHWDRIVRSVSSVQLYPAYGCGTHSIDNIVFWQALASRNNRAINTAYRANKKINCAVKQIAFNRPLNKGQLYVVSNHHRVLPHHIAFAMNQGWCRKTEKGIICIKNTDYEWWKSYFPKVKIKRNQPKSTLKVKSQKKKYDWGWPESD